MDAPEGEIVADDHLYEPLSCRGWTVESVPWSRLGTDWSQYAAVHVFHECIIPGASYDVKAIKEGCGTTSDVNF